MGIYTHKEPQHLCGSANCLHSQATTKKFHYKNKEIQIFAVCQVGSFTASVATIYSAFVVDRAIVSCRIDF